MSNVLKLIEKHIQILRFKFETFFIIYLFTYLLLLFGKQSRLGKEVISVIRVSSITSLSSPAVDAVISASLSKSLPNFMTCTYSF